MARTGLAHTGLARTAFGNTARLLLGLAFSCAALLLGGCQSFAISTPPDFVERPEPDWSSYSYRALNADAVVLGVREVDENEGRSLFEDTHDVSLTFWKKAVENRLRSSHAYALLGEDPLTVASGHKGTLLRLGREDAGVQYDYWVGLIDAGEYLYVLEAGGRREEFTKVQDALRSSIEGFQVK